MVVDEYGIVALQASQSKGSKKSKKGRGSTVNIKNSPFLLHDGDTLGVLVRTSLLEPIIYSQCAYTMYVYKHTLSFRAYCYYKDQVFCIIFAYQQKHSSKKQLHILLYISQVELTSFSVFMRLQFYVSLKDGCSLVILSPSNTASVAAIYSICACIADHMYSARDNNINTYGNIVIPCDVLLNE